MTSSSDGNAMSGSVGAEAWASESPDELTETASRDGAARLVLQCWSTEDPAGCVVIVHGLSDHGGRYGHLARWLGRSRLAAMAVDLRGHGKSSGQRGHAESWRALQDDVLLALDAAHQRFPGMPLWLLGHSMGGALVMTTVLFRTDDLARLPVQGVVAVSPLMLPTHNPPAWLWATAQLLQRVAPRCSFGTYIDVRQLSHDRAMTDRFRDDPLRHSRISSQLAVEMFSAGRQLYEATQPMPIPCLLMCGTDDALTSTAASEEWVQRRGDPNVTWRLWPGMYHEILHEVIREEAFDVIARWIERQPTAPSP